MSLVVMVLMMIVICVYAGLFNMMLLYVSYCENITCDYYYVTIDDNDEKGGILLIVSQIFIKVINFVNTVRLLLWPL